MRFDFHLLFSLTCEQQRDDNLAMIRTGFIPGFGSGSFNKGTEDSHERARFGWHPAPLKADMRFHRYFPGTKPASIASLGLLRNFS